MNIAVSLRLLALEVFEAVAPVRFAGALLALSIIDTSDADHSGEIARARSILKSAHDVLSDVVPARVKQIGSEPSKDLFNSRIALIDTLEHLMNAMPADIADHDIPDRLRARGIEQNELITKLEDVVNTYLTVTQQHISKVTEQQQRDNAMTIGGLLSRLGNISTSIELIAINAAIEAARTGPSGAGFAVIAREIQSLSGTMGEVVGAAQEELSVL